MTNLLINKMNKLEFDQACYLGEKLGNFSRDFLDAHYLTQIWMCRFYFDGRYFDLCNDISWKEKSLKHNLYRDYVDNVLLPVQFNASNRAEISWQMGDHSELKIEKFMLDHGILSVVDYFKVHSNYVDIYAFASDKGILNMSQVLPSMDKIDMFFQFLTERLDIMMSQDKYLLGSLGSGFNLSAKENEEADAYFPEKFSIKINNMSNHIKRDQLICLSLLSKGLTAKDIGMLLDVSNRTIESRINVLKNKFGTSTNQLIADFHKSPLANLNPFLLMERAR